MEYHQVSHCAFALWLASSPKVYVGEEKSLVVNYIIPLYNSVLFTQILKQFGIISF